MRAIWNAVFGAGPWLLSLALFGCAPEDPSTAPLRVAAAASLTGVMEETVGLWNSKEPRQAALTLAASSTLARQAGAGAPYDVFLSASAEWVDELEREGLAQRGSRVAIAGNALVLVVPRVPGARTSEAFPELDLGRAAEVLQPATAEGATLALADPSHVPAGQYAREALTSCGLFGQLEPHIVATANVRAALRLVERGEVDFGVVYATDALASPSVTVVGRFAESLHSPVEVELCVVEPGRADAQRFADWLRGDEIRTVFARHGFEVEL